MSEMTTLESYHAGKFHAEQDRGWEPELTPLGWMRTRQVDLPTWTVYETVGCPSYQTPRFYLPDEKSALRKLTEIRTTAP
jgi:hypothetical protein